MAAAELPDLPGRPAAWLYRRPVSWYLFLGTDRGEVAAAGLFRFLERNLEDIGQPPLASPENFQKNCPIYKIFICIFGKMGYNKME